MPWIFGWALIASLGLLSGCVDGNGARYWRLIYWLMGVVEEKSPCGSRSFGWLGSTTSSTSDIYLSILAKTRGPAKGLVVHSHIPVSG